MASPRTRRLLSELRPTNENTVSHFYIVLQRATYLLMHLRSYKSTYVGYITSCFFINFPFSEMFRMWRP